MLNETTQSILQIAIIITSFIIGGGSLLAFAKYLRSNPDKADALEAAIAGLTASVPAETMQEISKTIATVADLAKVFAGLIDRLPGIDPNVLTTLKAPDGTQVTVQTAASSTADVETKELPPYQADKPEGSG